MTEESDNKRSPPISQTRECAAPPLSSKPEIEGYTIVEELPRGGQAVVYKAIQTATGMKVALKVLPPSASEEARSYFEQEVRLAARLNHPNIVSIHESGIDKGQYYFSMEYIHGQALHRYVGTRAFSLRQKVVLFDRVCDAMTYAHQKGVIHRDLKPSNILVDERGEPHVLDFGLAKTAAGLLATPKGRDVMPTATGQLKGTVTYMAPEQAAARSDLIDVRTDVYSLGVILYHMLLGQFPYDVSGSVFETLHNIQYEEPVRPRRIVSGFDSDVEAVLSKALAKEPRQRYQSAAGLRDDILRWLEGRTISARPVTPWYLLRKYVFRHRVAAAIGILLVIIIVSTSFVGLYSLAHTRAARTQLDIQQRKSAANLRDNLALLNRAAFAILLQQWRDGREIGQEVFVHLSEDSRERRAARFLLDPRPFDLKKSDLHELEMDSDECFWQFIFGECYRKDGNETRAMEAYHRCLAVGQTSNDPNDWVPGLAQARLKALSNKE